MTENLGTPTKTIDLNGEQLVIEVRTDDPATTEEGDIWMRSDLAPEANQEGTLRFDAGTEVWDIPIFQKGTAVDTVVEVLGARINGVSGYVPAAPNGDAQFAELGFQHAGTRYGLHDAVEPVAIPDSVLEQFDDGNLNAYTDTGDWEITQNFVYEGTNAARAGDNGSPTTMYRTDTGPSQGEIFSAVFRDETGDANLRSGAAFGMNSNGDGYLLAANANDQLLELRTLAGADLDTTITDTSATVPAAEWFKLKCAWYTDDTIEGELWTLTGEGEEDTLQGSFSVVDSTFSSGGFGWGEFNAFNDSHTYADYYVIEEQI